MNMYLVPQHLFLDKPASAAAAGWCVCDIMPAVAVHMHTGVPF